MSFLSYWIICKYPSRMSARSLISGIWICGCYFRISSRCSFRISLSRLISRSYISAPLSLFRSLSISPCSCSNFFSSVWLVVRNDWSSCELIVENADVTCTFKWVWSIYSTLIPAYLSIPRHFRLSEVSMVTCCLSWAIIADCGSRLTMGLFFIFMARAAYRRVLELSS
jgi:hypothetical protein